MVGKPEFITANLFLTRDVDKNNIIVGYEGVIEYHTINYLLNNTIKELDILGINNTIKKKVIRIMMEILENSQKHSDNGQFSHLFSKFYLIKNESHIIFKTINPVLKINMVALQERIEEINRSDKNKLKQIQESKLINNELTKKGGSGIGLISIAIRSDNKFEYNFETIDNEISNFILQVKIKI